MTADRVPTRAEVPAADTWDLASLFPDRRRLGGRVRRVGEDARRLHPVPRPAGESADVLAECLRFDTAADRLGDRVGTYAFLKSSEDVGTRPTRDSRPGSWASPPGPVNWPATSARRSSRIPDEKLRQFIDSPALADYKIALERLLRFKPHTLSDKEERLLAMQAETAQTAHEVFDQLLNADLKFGTLEIAPGKTIELSHAILCRLPGEPGPQRAGRRRSTSTTRSTRTTPTRSPPRWPGRSSRTCTTRGPQNYPSAREAALFPDNVPVGRLRQPDRRRPGQPAGRPPLLPAPPPAHEACRTSTSTTPTSRS